MTETGVRAHQVENVVSIVLGEGHPRGECLLKSYDKDRRYHKEER